ncbi:MAG: hypothetical protein OXI73_14010 [Rhodospirillales bacterium]|nr:hypothetical protein [Rhodospirillales bacterium]
MSDSHDLHLREDLSKQENRVNVALFALMQQRWFREWILSKLGLPTDAIVYPPTDQYGLRPDLKVDSVDGKGLAWIEVELGKNPGQYKRYQSKFGPDQVKRLWGKRRHRGDLSLEEVAERVAAEEGLHPQVEKSARLLVRLIADGIAEHSHSLGRSTLSQEMRDHRLIRKLRNMLGNRLRFELGESEPPDPGQLKVNTTDTDNNRGFSLRVYSHVSKLPDSTVSVMSISGGRDRVNFPSLSMLQQYLPRCPEAVRDYRSALCDMNLDIGKFPLHGRPGLSLGAVLRGAQGLDAPLRALADCYGCPEPGGREQ